MPIQLNIEKRVKLGSREARRLRREQMLPGIVYGHGKDLSIKVTRDEFMSKIGYAKSLGIVELAYEEDTIKSIIKEVQWDTLTDEPLHLDFQQVLDNELVIVPVPVHLTGEPVGVTLDGGILDHTTHELNITVRAADIPSELAFDVSALHLGDRLHLSDVELPEGLIADYTFDPVIATVIAPKALLVQADEEEEVEGEEGEGSEDSDTDEKTEE